MAHFVFRGHASTQSGVTIGMLNCMARWYSTPGPSVRCVGPLPPYASLSAGIAVGVVHTKQFRSVHSIWHPSPSKRTLLPPIEWGHLPYRNKPRRLAVLDCARTGGLDVRWELPAGVLRMGWDV